MAHIKYWRQSSQLDCAYRFVLLAGWCVFGIAPVQAGSVTGGGCDSADREVAG